MPAPGGERAQIKFGREFDLTLRRQVLVWWFGCVV